MLSGMVPTGKLTEPYVIRPTSETIIGAAFSRWVESYRDLPLLIKHLLPTAGFPHTVRGVTPDVEQLLGEYHWPGNVRELRNTLLRAIPFADGDLIDMQSLPEALHPDLAADVQDDDPSLEAITMPRSDMAFHDAKESLIQAFERRYLEDLISRCEGNLSRAAREAGVDRKTVARMLKRHGIRS